jgi:hypothetical protein
MQIFYCYAESRYAECRYAECRGASELIEFWPQRQIDEMSLLFVSFYDKAFTKTSTKYFFWLK